MAPALAKLRTRLRLGTFSTALTLTIWKSRAWWRGPCLSVLTGWLMRDIPNPKVHHDVSLSVTQEGTDVKLDRCSDALLNHMDETVMVLLREARTVLVMKPQKDHNINEDIRNAE